MPGGYIIQNEDNTQAKSDVQKTPVLNPQTATTSTEPNKQLSTSDPSNGGITPSTYDVNNPQPNGGTNISKTDITNVNNQLAKGATYTGNELGNIYGLNTSGYLPSTQIDKLPEYKNVGDTVYKKNIISVGMTSQETPKYQELKNDFNAIGTNKQANSSIGLDINVGPSAENTYKIASVLLSSNDFINQSSISSYVQQAQSYLKQIDDITKKYSGDREQMLTQLQGPIGELKKVLSPMVESAKGQAYYLGLDDSNKKILETYLTDMNKFNLYYKKSYDDISGLKSSIDDSLKKLSVSYIDTKGRGTSIKAKETLNNNQYYQTFLDDVYKNNPMLRGSIDKFRNSDTISEDENNFITTYFFGPQGYANLKQAKSQALQTMDSYTANLMFKPFDDILKVSNLYYETEYDDLIDETFNVDGSYSTIQNTIDYSLNFGDF